MPVHVVCRDACPCRSMSFNFSKFDRIDEGFGHGLENVMTMIKRELRAKNTPNYVKGIMKKVARILVQK